LFFNFLPSFSPLFSTSVFSSTLFPLFPSSPLPFDLLPCISFNFFIYLYLCSVLFFSVLLSLSFRLPTP
jgi:hypothetical protein